MQLLYLWVDSYKNIKKNGFSFSESHDVSINFDEESSISKLFITEKRNAPQLFDPVIKSITGIIGKNGSGKTNILDIIGMHLNQRQIDKSSNYFLLYKQTTTKYVIEGNNIELIRPFTNGLIDSLFIHNPYSIIVRYDKEKCTFNYIDFLQEERKSINSFTVLSAKQEEYNLRSMFPTDTSYLFQRISLQPSRIGYYAKYKMLVDFNSDDPDMKHLFQAKNRIYLKITQNFKYFEDREYDLTLKISQDPLVRRLQKFFNNQNQNAELLTNQQRKIRWLLALTEKYIKFTWHSLVRHMKDNGEEKEILPLLREIESKVQSTDNPWGYYNEILRCLMEKLWDSTNEYAAGQNLFYFAYDELILLLLALPEEIFINEIIEIPIGSEEQEEIKNLLQKLDSEYLKNNSPDLLNRILDIEFYPFSSGEEAFLNLFATLYYGITLDTGYGGKTLLILLDEPDQFMHPEWCRQFIWEFIKFLKRIPSSYAKFQVVFTTHSPFLISDLPSSNVITLEKNQETGECIVLPKLTTQTFANNIHTLLADKFFLDSTTGEFALQTINYIIQQLNKSRPLGRKQKRKIYSLIELIGEPIIKQRLLEMYRTKVPDDKELRLRELLEQKAKIQLEIDTLEDEDR
ncbi:AAA family ATPase [Domibacillus sp. DTU_2020_1001157_1_SI_ALB_TIR_016]|uniref:AAA family ATPase n=1 Tax=Domibacillus sp. DTU_2020_1001157_1_SI_ALB_TIR_016 TaxID=3077789 RepID=UPI0028E4C2F6|nr:AAA family ATPase [Domibacillus sp. DTU_2020_1001157_1_SI_ALB_TIR_016]WNS82215.1 AAA family ATPase [Domibacillus sp. DTU_2020_1001157_1_SI_ALB_TIR_016]